MRRCVQGGRFCNDILSWTAGKRSDLDYPSGFCAKIFLQPHITMDQIKYPASWQLSPMMPSSRNLRKEYKNINNKVYYLALPRMDPSHHPFAFLASTSMMTMSMEWTGYYGSYTLTSLATVNSRIALSRPNVPTKTQGSPLYVVEGCKESRTSQCTVCLLIPIPEIILEHLLSGFKLRDYFLLMQIGLALFDVSGNCIGRTPDWT